MKNWPLIVVLLCITHFSNAQVVDKVKGAFISKTPVTAEGLANLEENKVDLSQLVVYISEEIHIQRNIPKDAEVISSTEGNIVYDNGKKIEKIKIVKGATGIITQSSSDSLKVKFENKEGYEFTFIKDKRGTDNTAAYYLKVSNDREVEYGPYEWYLNWGKGANVLWKYKEITKSVANTKRVKGIKPSGSQK
ncbi:hypothetical protein [Flammeovirga sp. SJP92]|uniref:hypothetical protein n=1 Tax=Flammeovirga sp. SJP92 TaxID=1775430 RepID=UPI000788B687|nr:hypothetical protein [Flammeovirga sp. SJP92]KXX69491.1 hypothetical protein AVL50_15570 [Flammeovirga sp. SJP92]